MREHFPCQVARTIHCVPNVIYERRRYTRGYTSFQMVFSISPSLSNMLAGSISAALRYEASLAPLESDAAGL